jgi:hypothetical protein
MKKVSLIAAIASILLASCSKDSSVDVVTDSQLMKVQVAGLKTKSPVSSFLTNDEIGVFINGTGYTPSVAGYKTANGGASWAPSASSVMLTGNTASVYAFYPSSLVLTPSGAGMDANSTFPVAVPASDDFAASAASDYLWGTGTSVSNADNSNTSVITLRHALAKISFVINKDANYPVSAGNITNITLSSAGSTLVNSGTTAVGTGAFTATGYTDKFEYVPATATNINELGGSTVTAYALVAPCNYTSGDLKLSVIIDGKAMPVTGFVSPDWSQVDAANSNSYREYRYVITVSPTGLIVSTVNIITWVADTSAGGLIAL